MESFTLFDRQLEVKIATAIKQLVIKDLHMSFEVEASSESDPNTARVTIYNLSSDSRDIISTGLAALEIHAGYPGTKALIFKGSTKNTMHRREGVDWVTTIEAEDLGKTTAILQMEAAIKNVKDEKKRKQLVAAWEATYQTSLSVLYSRFKKSYAIGTPIQLILTEIVARTGIPFEMGFVPVADVLTSGWAVDESVKGALDLLCSRYHLQWSIHHGILEVKDAALPVASAVASFCLLSSDTGLIGEPEAAIEVSEEDGSVGYITAKSLLQPGLRPGRPVMILPVNPGSAVGMAKVKNKLDKALAVKASGMFIVDRVTHHGSNFESDFYSEIVAKVWQ